MLESLVTLEYRCAEGKRIRSGRSWGLILGPEYQDLLMGGLSKKPLNYRKACLELRPRKMC